MAAYIGEHSVRPGETLSSIAVLYGLDWKKLAIINKMTFPFTLHTSDIVSLYEEDKEFIGNNNFHKKNLSKPQIWGLPTQCNYLVKQNFHYKRHPRNGVTISGSIGQPVLAVQEGKVIYAGTNLRNYGGLVIIRHNADFLSAYGYNREFFVKKGQVVFKGEKIAEMGLDSTGNAKTYFELRYRGKRVDPRRFLKIDSCNYFFD